MNWNTGMHGDELEAHREFTVKYFTARVPEINDGDEPPELGGAVTPPPAPPLPQVEPTPTPPPSPQELEHSTSLDEDDDRLDAYHDESPVRYRRIVNIIGDEEQVLPTTCSSPGLAWTTATRAGRTSSRRD